MGPPTSSEGSRDKTGNGSDLLSLEGCPGAQVLVTWEYQVSWSLMISLQNYLRRVLVKQMKKIIRKSLIPSNGPTQKGTINPLEGK